MSFPCVDWRPETGVTQVFILQTGSSFKLVHPQNRFILQTGSSSKLVHPPNWFSSSKQVFILQTGSSSKQVHSPNWFILQTGSSSKLVFILQTGFHPPNRFSSSKLVHPPNLFILQIGSSSKQVHPPNWFILQTGFHISNRFILQTGSSSKQVHTPNWFSSSKLVHPPNRFSSSKLVHPPNWFILQTGFHPPNWFILQTGSSSKLVFILQTGSSSKLVHPPNWFILQTGSSSDIYLFSFPVDLTNTLSPGLLQRPSEDKQTSSGWRGFLSGVGLSLPAGLCQLAPPALHLGPRRMLLRAKAPDIPEHVLRLAGVGPDRLRAEWSLPAFISMFLPEFPHRSVPGHQDFQVGCGVKTEVSHLPSLPPYFLSSSPNFLSYS